MTHMAITPVQYKCYQVNKTAWQEKYKRKWAQFYKIRWCRGASACL